MRCFEILFFLQIFQGYSRTSSQRLFSISVHPRKSAVRSWFFFWLRLCSTVSLVVIGLSRPARDL
jgi:hypothetical protein